MIMLSKLGKKLVKKYGLTGEQAEEIEDMFADAYAHPTKPGWCCACDLDISFFSKDYVRKVNRVEVIDHTKNGVGRAFVQWKDKLNVELALQDKDRTLKIFIRDKESDE